MARPLGIDAFRRARHPLWLGGWVTIILILVVSVVAIPRASAHGEMVEARPGRSSTVGGSIDQVELQFVGITHPGDHRVSVTAPDGRPVPTTGELQQNLQLLTLPIEPLSAPGEYFVNYRVDSIDGDISVATFSFTYEAGADPPAPFTSRQESRTSSGSRPTVAIVGMSAIVVVFVAWIGRRLWDTR